MFTFFFKLCRHIMNFHVPGIHYRFSFSALLILGINNFQCNLDIHGVVFNLALLYYLFFSILLCTIIHVPGDINDFIISFGFEFICSKRWLVVFKWSPLVKWLLPYILFCYLNSWHPCQIKCLTNKQKYIEYWPMAFIELMW